MTYQRKGVDISGYYWTIYKDFQVPMIVEIRFETWDHTRDGDRWALWDGDVEVPVSEWYKYRFLKKVEEPEWPYEGDIDLLGEVGFV